MQAQVGDHLMIEGSTAESHRREGEIIEVQGAEGGPPFLVRWSDTSTESLVYPGPDAHVTPRS